MAGLDAVGGGGEVGKDGLEVEVSDKGQRGQGAGIGEVVGDLLYGAAGVTGLDVGGGAAGGEGPGVIGGVEHEFGVGFGAAVPGLGAGNVAAFGQQAEENPLVDRGGIDHAVELLGNGAIAQGGAAVVFGRVVGKAQVDLVEVREASGAFGEFAGAGEGGEGDGDKDGDDGDHDEEFDEGEGGGFAGMSHDFPYFNPRIIQSHALRCDSIPRFIAEGCAKASRLLFFDGDELAGEEQGEGFDDFLAMDAGEGQGDLRFHQAEGNAGIVAFAVDVEAEVFFDEMGAHEFLTACELDFFFSRRLFLM